MSEPTELRRLLGEGTPGPWTFNRHREGGDWLGNVQGHYPDGSIRTITCNTLYGESAEREANAALITAAVNALPGLLDRVEELEKALSVAEDALRDYACHAGPDIPCRRSPDQCASECGKSAGDAFVAVQAALSPSMKVER